MDLLLCREEREIAHVQRRGCAAKTLTSNLELKTTLVLTQFAASALPNGL